MDIRQKTDTLTVDGRTWTITCNFNVLADVQEQYGGNLVAALTDASKRPMRTALTFAAAMVNDAAEAAGEAVRYTPAELGRKLPTAMPGLFADRIMALVWAALDLPERRGDAEAKTGGPEGEPKADPEGN